MALVAVLIFKKRGSKGNFQKGEEQEFKWKGGLGGFGDVVGRSS